MHSISSRCKKVSIVSSHDYLRSYPDLRYLVFLLLSSSKLASQVGLMKRRKIYDDEMP